MSFKRRNVALANNVSDSKAGYPSTSSKVSLPGCRPSTVDGRLVTSTGTSTLDGLLAGHGGLALGCSLLMGESGTTDYAGALLKFFAAEGLLQGHHIHVVGLPEQWARELPGVVDGKDTKKIKAEGEKMKIAWRYESLGEFNAGRKREASTQQTQASTQNPSSSDQIQRFSHSFDLTKRLDHPASATINFIPLSTSSNGSPFASVLAKVKALLASAPAGTVHRLLIPSLLSPLLYPYSTSQPQDVLPFLHSIRGLLLTFNLTAMVTMPLSLHPRSSGLTRWIELLSDGVLELAPFPHTAIATTSPSPKSTAAEEPPQGLLRIYKLPILHELGSGIRSYDDDWTFTLSRKKLNIKPYNLPPLSGDTEAQQDSSKVFADQEDQREAKKVNITNMEF